LIEPMFGLDTQRVIWASGFGLLMLMLGACAVLMLSTRLDIGASSSPAAVVSSPTISNKDRFSWVGLAFIPSALLLAFTTHITTDIASAPFLWVIPLATFLGTFVIVFRDRSLIPHWAVLRIHPLLVASAILFVVMPNAGSTVVQAVLGFATFVVTILVCHRALYEQRPAAAQLTEFYLYMSLGGVLGGMFAALLAPQLFNTVVEYPLLIVIGLLARPGAVAALRPLGAGGLTREKWLLIIATIAVVILQLTGWLPMQLSVLGVTFLSLLLAGLIVFAHARLEIMSLSSVLAIIVTLSAATAKVDSHSERSFFGVSRVMQSADGGYRLLVHGSTVHGGQKLRDADGSETKDAPPIMYYHPASPMARGFDLARTVGNASSDRLNVGIVGLGTGSLACYLQPGEKITYFEIDPVVVSIARDPKHFTFMSRCAPDAVTVLGDARLTLAKQPSAAFDYLVIDAFSSDAVPVHLLTREAVELYMSRIKPNGLLALHISNRHMELESVVAATAAKIPDVQMAVVLKPNPMSKANRDAHRSHVVYLSKDRAIIDRAMQMPHARTANPRATASWSDNYADILSAIWRRYTDH
jgi:spermidine synthase